MDVLTIVVMTLVFIGLIIFFYYVPFMLWINAAVSGVHISLVQLFLMRIRKVPPTKIVNCMIEAHKAGLTDVKRDGLEAHYLAGGHIERVSVTVWRRITSPADISSASYTPSFLRAKQVLICLSRWLRRLTLPDVTCSKPCR